MPRDRHFWTEELFARRPPRRTESANRLVLLGTGGGSNPKMTRCGYSNAVVIGETAYVVDCGEGVSPQLQRAGLPATRRFGNPDRPVVEAIFLTHLHADHLMDLVNILQGSWPSQTIDIYGPGPAGPPFTTHDDPVHPVRYADDPAPGIRRVLDHLNRAFATNSNARVIAENRGDYIDHIRVHQIGLAGERDGGERHDIEIELALDRPAAFFEVPEVEPFVVLPRDVHGVEVTATLVQHAPMFPALAYRFDTPTGSVVFSGDTGPCENVVRLARGADILVHEVIDIEALMGRLTKLTNFETVKRQLLRSHTSVDVVGGIAERAGVGTLVLSHLVPAEGAHTPDEWESMVRGGAPGFAGEIVCGVDLDEFALGD